MKIIDLHTHTTFSDGTFTPKELVQYAKEKGLSAIAVTDHDVFDGVEQAQYYGEKLGIEVISGIEISTQYEGVEMHIVGLFVDIYDKHFNSVLDSMRQKRVERNNVVISKLQALGLDITMDEVKATADGSIVTRAHFAKTLKQKGYVSNIGEAFEKYIGDGKSAYVKREVFDWQQTINMINNAGGVAVLAHPLIYKISNKRLENAIADMANSGLKGIEAYYSTHSPSDVKYVKMLAYKNGLKLSGGSDFHGANKPRLDLGTGYGDLAVPYELLEALKGVK